MTDLVKDIMVKTFDTVLPDAPIEHAIQKILKSRVRETGYKAQSLMVVDDFNSFVGIITMFDILYHLRPTFLNYGLNGDMISWEGEFQKCVKDLKSKKVHQVMSTNLVAAALDEHLMVVLDRMIKNRYHRLPVLDSGQLIGMVYITDIYHYLFSDQTP